MDGRKSYRHRRMERNTVLWALVVFFGASLMFSAIRRATEGESAGLSLGLQALAGLVLAAAIVVVVRRRR
jgi:drug/metabolite transporter (DMT)-like permease